MIKLIKNNVDTEIHGKLDLVCQEELDKFLSYRVKDYFFTWQYKKGIWDGYRRFFKDCGDDVYSFPTGLVNEVTKILKANYDDKIKIVDERKRWKSKEEIPFTKKGSKIKFREYQKEAIHIAINEARGIVKGATGCGKSFILMNIIRLLGLPALVYVNRQDIFHQLYETLNDNLDIEIGRIGAGIIDVKKVNVVMYQTMIAALGYSKEKTKYQDNDKTNIKKKLVNKLVTSFPVMIVDESHHGSCASLWQLQKKSINAYYRIFTTATPWREDGADIMIEAASGPKICDISASKLINEGYLSRPYIYMLQYEMPEKYSKLSYAKAYSYGIVQNSERNILILKMAIKATLSEKRTLIAIKQIKHGNELENTLNETLPAFKDKIRFVHGSCESEERKAALKDLNCGKIFVVVATSIFGEGVDIPNLDIIINAKAQKSSIDAMQLAGRVLRTGDNKKKEVMIIDIADSGQKNFNKYTKARIKIYESEEEFVIKEVFDIDDIKEPYWV